MFEGEYLNGKRWNGKGYNKKDKVEYQITNGTGYIKDYDNDGESKFEEQYLNGIKKNIITIPKFKPIFPFKTEYE